MRHTSFLALLIVVLLAACSGEKPFRITGEISDGSSTNLYVRYYGENALNTLVTASRDGKFETEGFAESPTVARVLDKDNRLLALVFVQNGDEINLTVDRGSMPASKVTGNAVNDALTAFLNANETTLNTGTPAEINAIVEKYVKAHPADIVSAVLLSNIYDAAADPAGAAGLLATLAPEAQLPFVIGQLSIQCQRFATPEALGKIGGFKYLKAGKDSAQTFSTADKEISLLAFTDNNCQRSDSVVPQLKAIYKAAGSSRLQIIDMVIANDTTAMKGLTRLDSAGWAQGWVPGGLLSDQLYAIGIPALPYYIVAGADGTQHYRGKSIEAARKAIEAQVR